MNSEEGSVECSTSPDAAHEYWKALEEDDMMFALSPETNRRAAADKTRKESENLFENKFFPSIKVEPSLSTMPMADHCQFASHPAYTQQHFNMPQGGAWGEHFIQQPVAVSEGIPNHQLSFDPSMFPADFLNYVPMQVPYEQQHQHHNEKIPLPTLQEEIAEDLARKMRPPSGQPVRIVTPASTVPRTKTVRKRRKRSASAEGDEESNDMQEGFNGFAEQGRGSGKEVESLLKQLGNGDVTLHVYENAQRLYIRYINENGVWQMRDVADFVNVKFHTDSDSSTPVPPPTSSAENGTEVSCQQTGDTSSLSLIPAMSQLNQHPTVVTAQCAGGIPLTLAEPVFPFNMMGEIPTFPGAPGTSCVMVPQQMRKELSRDLVLEFKRKEHYWRRGIWVRVVVDIVAKGGNGMPVREAGGSINVALLSVKGKVIKKACEKCSKYYFRYKNIESTGQAPAFEIEERERCTAVRGGRASFNMRVWECSHHYLSPHTLLFSWVDPCNPCMRTVALCPKEIVISSGSGQEKKLKEMTVSREEVFRDFADALILMESAQYCRAIEALRCIRWKCFHFLGVGLPSIVDEKIGDCFLRMGDYKGAMEHFGRSIGQLNKARDRMDPVVQLFVRALLYLKLSNAAYSRERDSVQVMNLKKCSKTLRKSRDAFLRGLEYEQQMTMMESANQGEKEGEEMGNLGDAGMQKEAVLSSFVRKYLKFAYYQSMTGLFLKLKPFQLAMGDLAGSISYEVIAQAMEEAEKNLNSLQKEEKAWYSTDMLAIFGPLVEKLHTGVDSLKKLLHSPFATNKVITQFSLMSEQSPILPEQLGDKVLSVLKELKQAADEAEELHPKGHRTICICKCLLALFMYLGGQLTREEALRSVEEILRQIEKFWKANGGVSGGRFECQQVASIGEYIRSNQRNMGNPFAVFDDREHMQLYRMWIHSPLDIALWALQVQITWN